jgi:hypothetical protein
MGTHFVKCKCYIVILEIFIECIEGNILNILHFNPQWFCEAFTIIIYTLQVKIKGMKELNNLSKSESEEWS